MNFNQYLTSFIFITGFYYSCQGQKKTLSSDLDRIQLPSGFHIEVYAEDIPNARGMSLAPDGTLFAGSKEKGAIYAITKDRKVIILDKGLNMPAGLACYKGDLYVSAVSKILSMLPSHGSTRTEVIWRSSHTV